MAESMAHPASSATIATLMRRDIRQIATASCKRLKTSTWNRTHTLARLRRGRTPGRPPPVVELSKRSFAEQAKAYHGDEIKHIAANPQEYSPHISDKAKRTKKVAKKYGTTQYDTANARYFRYQLGNKSVGLLRTEGGFAMRDVFAEEQWRKSFPGRNEVTSTVDLQIVHPLVDNAGDILLEHQLRLDGDNALLHSRPANREARARSLQLGFVDVDADNMVLDPTQHPEKWIKNRDDEWQRADKPGLYLSKAEDGDSQSETPRVQSEDEYDFM